MAPIIRSRKSLMGVVLLNVEAVVQARHVTGARPSRALAHESRGERARHGLNGEYLVTGRPHQAPEHLGADRIDDVYRTLASVDVQAGRILRKPRDDARGGDAGDVAGKAQPAGP